MVFSPNMPGVGPHLDAGFESLKEEGEGGQVPASLEDETDDTLNEFVRRTEKNNKTLLEMGVSENGTKNLFISWYSKYSI